MTETQPMRCTCARSWGLHSKTCGAYVPGHELASPVLAALERERAGARYFVDYGAGEIEVDMDEFVGAERQAGFHNTLGRPDLPATTSFSGKGITGRTEYRKEQP